MQQAIRSNEMAYGEAYVTKFDVTTEAEDDLGFAAALKLAIPAGIALWAVAIWGALQLFA